MRAVRTTVLIGIAVRLFFIYACANQIAVGYRVLGFTDSTGQLAVSGPTAYDLARQANDADGMVKFALWAGVAAVVLFIIASISVLRRKRRGEPVAVAFDQNRAVRLAGRLYGAVADLGTDADGVHPRPDRESRQPAESVRAFSRDEHALLVCGTSPACPSGTS